ncbi:MAG: GGDEF domain-containing protein, partial [Candidatus Daviesbacteria bacterium]|nr:GGDEF domain-containing protein [Candidatus Daviesbacteria bacterium]
MESPQGIEEQQQEQTPLYEEEDLIEASNFIQSLDLDPKTFNTQAEELAKVYYERRKLKELAVYDPLTKLLNRRGFVRALNTQLAELGRLHAP